MITVDFCGEEFHPSKGLLTKKEVKDYKNFNAEYLS